MILVRSGKRKEAFKLAREIKLISDPDISVSEVHIGEAIKAYYGNLEGAADLLGFKDLKNGVSWIEFIVRTWGFTPEEIAGM